MSITVYSKPSCPGCVQTKNYLDGKGILYNTIDITEDTNALMKIKEMGFRQVPVVEYNGEFWSGFNPAKLAEVVA